MTNLIISITSIEEKNSIEQAGCILYNEKKGTYLLPTDAIGIDLKGYSIINRSSLSIEVKQPEKNNAEKRKEKEIRVYQKLISQGYTKKDLSKWNFFDVNLKVVSIEEISSNKIEECLIATSHKDLKNVIIKHISTRSNSKTLKSALKIGQTVTAKVLSLEEPETKVAIGIKLYKPEYIASKYLRLK
jgi:ribosomal protein S1